MKKILDSNWLVMQDVHDVAEALALFDDQLDLTAVGHQLSEWEPIDGLEHLQVMLAEHPYWGRQLRYFNQAPWWYRNSFDLTPEPGARTRLRFTNVDYFCKVWLNGRLLGEHEGYSVPFEFDVTDALHADAANELVVKVWSPWDTAVHGDAFASRTFQVRRDLVKGTYEHDDTLVARDVNPVGIYGEVSLTSTVGPRFVGRPRITCRLSDEFGSARVTVRGTVADVAGAAVEIGLSLCDERSLSVRATHAEIVAGNGEHPFEISFTVDGIEPWTVWDQGDQPLYQLALSLDGRIAQSRRIAFRTAALERDDQHTSFLINGKRLFVRGTSYFPDVYISTMTPERYRRDLMAIKAAGFNLVRVHVHVESETFYSLCDELGIAVMQDSEYNWTHPVDESWAERLTSIYEQTMAMLDDHPSLICWICLNEPGVMDPGGRTHGYAMDISPGPRLYAAVTAFDPSRPAIKGSFCDDDLTSGDSHNYTGSLQGPDVHYTAIDGTTEKLNTEFGFDAPASIGNLRKVPDILARLTGKPEVIAEAQHYQYRLIKYYIEHYRAQKYAPCSGYVQFMFIDLCPQSFYGVYDWWGVPKPALAALMESNQPIVALIEQTRDRMSAVRLINDSSADLGEVTVSWQVCDAAGGSLAAGSRRVECGPDSHVLVAPLELTSNEAGGVINASVLVRDGSGRLVATNRYRDLFNHPEHVKGHPRRMSHEYGMRLYSA